VRRSLRGGLVDRWERPLQEGEEMAMWKYVRSDLDNFTEQSFLPEDEGKLLKDGKDK